MKLQRTERPKNLISFPIEINHESLNWVDGTIHYRILKQDMKQCMFPERCEYFCYGTCKISRCKFKSLIQDSKVITMKDKGDCL